MGYSILEFEVSDVDSPPNGAPFNFAIISGDEENKFMINHKTGTLSTRASFNRQLKVIKLKLCRRALLSIVRLFGHCSEPFPTIRPYTQ